MVGILVNGDNHFIVRGPLPDREVALALVRHWSLIQIGATTLPALNRWQIISQEFRENLEWAVVIPGEDEISPAVTKLLHELSALGITIHNSRLGSGKANDAVNRPRKKRSGKHRGRIPDEWLKITALLQTGRMSLVA